ncbi:MAG TPA: hypothetical protein PKJ79_18630, partial [Quisquiliibacterium sp.]|nr:hypothetical protein [Quisquiliibacterium sp.]
MLVVVIVISFVRERPENSGLRPMIEEPAVAAPAFRPWCWGMAAQAIGRDRRVMKCRSARRDDPDDVRIGARPILRAEPVRAARTAGFCAGHLDS